MSRADSIDGRQRRCRVGIVGSYGGCNLGDEAILQVIVAQLRASRPVEVTVFSHEPVHTRARHPVDRAVALRSPSREELRRQVEPLDLLILGGGGILFDTNTQPYVNVMRLAQEMGIKTIVYAVGAGPLDNPTEQERVRDCLSRADAVTVRDRPSYEALEGAGVRCPIEITADPAFLLEPAPLPSDALTREGLRDGRRLVGISVRERGAATTDLHNVDYHALLADAADFVVDRFDVDVVFVPMERRGPDIPQAHAVISRMTYADRAIVLTGDYTPDQMLAIFDRFTFVVGLRLHSLLFAALRRVPFVALPYAGKVTGFLDQLHLATPPLPGLNAGRLIAQIDRSWDRSDEFRCHLDRVLPELRDRARQTHQIALKLLASPSAPSSPTV